MKRRVPSQTFEERFFSPDSRNTPLSETICLGAQLILQKAVERNVTEWGRVKITPAIGRDSDSPKTDCKAKPGVRLAAQTLSENGSDCVPNAGPQTGRRFSLLMLTPW